MGPVIKGKADDYDIKGIKDNSLVSGGGLSDAKLDLTENTLAELSGTKAVLFTMFPFLQPDIDASKTIINLQEYRDKVDRITKIKEADDYNQQKAA